ncbi:MAG TPA: tricarballylate utilization 4Fe-4S protein TcuB [Bryobacteraceae bacterium]|nr:tricarballylate utilization 4Fe-4S protein TcuB [Bryobacteraceae bacterium]
MPHDPETGQSTAAANLAEGERLMTICNACRYCEGYCAVFPAMERRLTFTSGDLRYLANLCHNCAECYYACQYAPPHEFAVNVPKVFAQIRADSYRHYAWPSALATLFARGKFVQWILGMIAIGMSVGALGGPVFYDVIPHEDMVAIFLIVSAVILTAHVGGFLRFWKDAGENVKRFFQLGALVKAAGDALALVNLSSGGAGCAYPDQKHSQARRVYHHFTFYGFLLCFASTTVAAIDHALGYIAPHPYGSAPVILGTLGGIGLLIGPIGLYFLKRKRDPAIADAAQDGSDKSFLALLFLTSITGLGLLALRETSAMGMLLVIHLAVVLFLFLTLPYGKFVHGIYRSAALVKSALEGLDRRTTHGAVD